ncbi:hypothetical protein Moror_93 [Moniliophthora roreri MCA 2997]|uniref:Uncharacterized protein n=2 Tax=Moniliophthora roreri TaxID=221103 RepID=V2XGL2_MONRO|nr:hypothetical protein Moror_93 [Moniliophthora roreri MCA 2997]KAI3622149.1 hypothetical protein WG66_015457 [Moniliophthora roreri]
MSELQPPPTYSQELQDQVPGDPQGDAPGLPQILIVPTVVSFQKGFLGAEGERAAIEGELQLKGAEAQDWNKVTISLRTVESAHTREIELNVSQIILFSRVPDMPLTALPSSLLFAIPLMQDTPQTIHTPISSLTHTLTATLYPTNPMRIPLSKSLAVHTKRYTSHEHTLLTTPETYRLTEPTRVEVQVPRTSFKSGEPIPVYVKIPPPRRELVVDESLRLRNVKAELVRTIKVRQDEEESAVSHTEDTSLAQLEGPSTAPLTSEKGRFSKIPVSPMFAGPMYKAVLARSGASCRFHSQRPVQLRFVLHQVSPFSSPSNTSLELPGGDPDGLDLDSEGASISQVTLLHSVSFQINVHVSFVDVSTHSERVFTIQIPVTMVAPPAPLPEVAPAFDEAYQKKHDRPPVKTNRYDDSDLSAPYYSPAEAGPSGLLHGAPPPFEERDAPPPFFSSAAEASTSARLPTFLESETEIIIPENLDDDVNEHPHPVLIEGEGIDFGFVSSEQFDGYSEDMRGSSTPPPTLEMASRDPDVTQLADIREPERAMEAIGLALSQGEHPPPPPPALDDPSDPPPSIDSDFRLPDPPRAISPQGPSSPHVHPVYVPEPPRLHDNSPPPPSVQDQSGHGHAPPPYLVRESHHHADVQEEHVSRPPPYVD